MDGLPGYHFQFHFLFSFRLFTAAHIVMNKKPRNRQCVCLIAALLSTLPLSPHFRHKLAAQLAAQPVILLDGLAHTAVVVVKSTQHQRTLLAAAIFMAA